MAARWLRLLVLAPALALGAAGQMSAIHPAGLPPQQPDPVTWQSLPHGGLNGLVTALAAAGNNLYVGGFFTETADGQVQNLNGIALLSGGQWVALPHHGLNAPVAALAVLGSDVYAGGYFTETADGALTNLNYVARLSSDGWHPLEDNGLNSDVTALAAHGSDLYVGGFFDQSAGGAVKDLNLIAKYSGGHWVALPNKGLYTFFVLHAFWVNAIAFNGNDMVVSGGITATEDLTVQNMIGIAKLSGGTTWSALPDVGLARIFPPRIPTSLAYVGNDLYAAGTFTSTTDGAVPNLNGIARLSNGVWSPLPHDGFRRDPNTGDAYVVAARGADLYVGGPFTQTADGLVQNLNSIAEFSGGAWQALPEHGLRPAEGYGVDAITFAGNNLYAGGAFTETADGTVQNLGNIAVLAVPPLASYSLYLPLVSR